MLQDQLLADIHRQEYPLIISVSAAGVELASTNHYFSYSEYDPADVPSVVSAELKEYFGEVIRQIMKEAYVKVGIISKIVKKERKQ